MTVVVLSAAAGRASRVAVEEPEVGCHDQVRQQPLSGATPAIRSVTRPWCPLQFGQVGGSHAYATAALPLLVQIGICPRVSPAGFLEAQAAATDPLASSHLREAHGDQHTAG